MQHNQLFFMKGKKNLRLKIFFLKNYTCSPMLICFMYVIILMGGGDQICRNDYNKNNDKTKSHKSVNTFLIQITQNLQKFSILKRGKFFFFFFFFV